MRLDALTRREASIFACLADTAVSPGGILPPVAQTDAVWAFDRWLTSSPRLNRVALRAVLYAIEVAPALGAQRARLRRLPRERRVEALRAIEGARWWRVRQLAKLVKGMAFLSYYGDDAVMLRLGYDADANARRGRELRAKEGRP